MDRKSVWIEGRQIFILPWAKVWDALLAAPEDDFLDVWNGRAFLMDEYGRRVSPDGEPYSGQKIFIRRQEHFETRDRLAGA
ncbi:MAG: hypothetical protein HZA60_07945 [Deltaproteobacteria bacterium]|nr:hypothetical protein [Deltaproteobacteria bacterium]